MTKRLALALVATLALGGLAGCQSSEEKAEEHYTSGMTLLAAGDIDRALVEFRNVFKLNGQHREARKTYARIQREKGNLREAYGQYLRLAEQYPEDFDANLALAEMALMNGAWDDAEKYGRNAAAADPEDARARGVKTIVDYRTALTAEDRPAMAAALTTAAALLQDNPDLVLVRKLLADEKMRTGDFADARVLVEEGLARDPSADDFYAMQLNILYQLGDTAGVTALLKSMIARQPDNAEARTMLVSWYLGQNDVVSAEAALRAEIDPANDALEPRVQLLSFLAQIKGEAAASEEAKALMAANPASAHTALYRSMVAGYEFNAGSKDAAIAEMRAIVAEYPDSKQINAIKIGLAQMLSSTGNEVGARAMVEEVLENDPTDVPALKAKATWLIEDDQTGDALVTLRTALEQSAQDPEIMTLMARAHERDGSTDLMGEMLSLAVSASSQAPPESLRYAAFLQSQGKLLPAEDTLLNALRRVPENIDLLAALGGIYMQMKDWGRADQIVRTLESGKTDLARRMGQEMKARLLASSGREEELTQFLETVANDADGPGADIALVRDVIRRGEYDKALQQVAAIEAKYPDMPQVGLLEALVLASAGRMPDAVARLESLTATHPDFEQGWLALFNMHTAAGDGDKAETVLQSARAALPESRLLQWADAGRLEQSGDIDGAIAIYDSLYEKDSNWAVVANNLASLLANTRTDEASLDRAYRIARRLRGSTEPAFQDTYGWIVFRRGNPEEALIYLEPAAAGLPKDMTVQYHLAMTYGALNRKDEAMAILTALVATVPGPPPALETDIKAEIARLSAPPDAGSGGN